MIGNHDAIPDRKAFKYGISKHWLKSIEDVLSVPTWEFHEELVVNDILFTHGIGMQATSRMRKMLISVVQSHYHTKTYLENLKGLNRNVFAMQLGCLIDQESYAMAYARFGSNLQLNCGAIVDHKYPRIITMEE